MRSANLLNDFAFKYVFGEDCKEANDALKSLLTVFLKRKVNHVVVKNIWTWWRWRNTALITPLRR